MYMNDISKEFSDYYLSLEKLLNEACVKANSECNADMLQRIVDLHETAKFIFTDFDEFTNILAEIDFYMADKNKEDEELT